MGGLRPLGRTFSLCAASVKNLLVFEMIKSSPKTAAKHRLILQLDALARQRCFWRDMATVRGAVGSIQMPVCQFCGSSRSPEWAHVFGRRDLSIRWELDNNLTLCGPGGDNCHQWFDDHKSEALVWFGSCWYDRMNHIREIQQSRVRVDLKQLLAEMRA